MTSNQAPHPPTDRTASALRQVLVVGDEPSDQGSLVKFLGCRGYGVRQPAAGCQTLERLGESDPWLVLIDVKKARLGVDMLKLVKKRWRQTAVVILSADVRTGAVLEAMREGASDFLAKPFGPEVLDRVLVRLQNSVGDQSASSQQAGQVFQ